MKYFLIVPVSLIVVGLSILIEYRLTNSEDDPVVRVSELRMYDHDIQTKPGGIADIRHNLNENKKETDRSHERIQRVWEYTNSIDARVYELEKRLNNMQSNRQQPVQEVVTMISNERGQSYSLPDTNNHKVQKAKIRTNRNKVNDMEARDIINSVVGEYQIRINRDINRCTVGGVPVSLGDIALAKVIQEGGWLEGGLGRRTNNPGSLGTSFIGKTSGVMRADNRNTWQIYASPEEGFLDLLYVIENNYRCTITVDSIFVYVYGPRAERTEGRMDHARAIFNNHYAYLMR